MYVLERKIQIDDHKCETFVIGIYNSFLSAIADMPIKCGAFMECPSDEEGVVWNGQRIAYDEYGPGTWKNQQYVIHRVKDDPQKQQLLL